LRSKESTNECSFAASLEEAEVKLEENHMKRVGIFLINLINISSIFSEEWVVNYRKNNNILLNTFSFH
jgi:hypothetical protein